MRKKGFLYDTGDWSEIFADETDGVIFMGWGGAAPGFYTFFAVVVCVVVLCKGNKSEHEKHDQVGK